ncbi:helix-turn-helix domain-containing protein [Streptomyces niveus]|uniref:helix-turn-helix domain-containing protein n=1 Tax=Streptomyces niveus TaxID=193462 RepID=UPI003444AF8A
MLDGPAVDELLLLHERAGLNTGQIAELYGLQEPTVAAQLSFVGAKPRPGPAPEGWRRASATVAQLYECGLSVKRVGELCGMSYGAAYSRLRKLGVTLRSRGASTAHPRRPSNSRRGTTAACRWRW